ncbi:hypothetical protein OHA37_20525 [Streptomyces sp. NBC_00335]|uniref:hypothetical protein n=1 Tax=unclassified Streptomyces TaxID=2593676 RepID=UPI00225153AA|nr:MULTISPECIES: hypothetical protein [unclassified Streptomyces]MCX5406247.1 hypothetical protein [Streptomyces sp. NBC_00086]
MTTPSTPEEQQQQLQQQQQQQFLEQQQQQQPDPYGTQTWQSPTWDTSYQPVQAPLDGVPAQYPVAPEGWFREEPQAPGQGQGQGQPQAPVSGQEWGQQQAYADPYQDPYAAQAHPQTAAPDHWFREEAQAPQAEQPQQWGEAAYPAPYPGPSEPFQAEAHAAQAQAAQAHPAQVQAPAPGQEWVAEAAPYLPPQADQAPDGAPAAPAVAADGAAEEEPAWSPPTLAGNTLRAVDPAQARAEGRSPIIDPGPQAAILTAALGLVLAAAAALSEYALLAPLIALQGLTAAGWFRLNGMWPARQGIALAFAGAVVADVAVLAVDEPYGPGAIVGTLGAWVLLTLVLQLRSHADPDERMYGLMASVASAALAVVCAGYLAADSAAVSVGAAAVAVAVFARALPLPTAPSVGVSLAAAAGAGIAVGGLTSVGAGGALIGLAAGVCALIGLRVAAYDYPSKFVHMTAGVALPLAAAAPAVYLIGRVVG